MQASSRMDGRGGARSKGRDDPGPMGTAVPRSRQRVTGAGARPRDRGASDTDDASGGTGPEAHACRDATHRQQTPDDPPAVVRTQRAVSLPDFTRPSAEQRIETSPHTPPIPR